MTEGIIAFVPMKGHSERLPGKNTRAIGGKPLCFWILETLSRSTRVGRIVVNTDSEEIARITTAHFDVTIHERPADLCGDFVSVNLLIAHDMSLLPDADCFLQTHATNPLLRAETVDRILTTWLAAELEHDSVFTVTRHAARFYDRHLRPINHDPKELRRTQDLDPLFEENSNLYAFTRASFQRTSARIGATPLMVEIDPREALDIDELAEWELAEWMLTRPRS